MKSPRIAMASSVLSVVLGLGFASAQEAAIRQGDSVTIVVPRAEVRSGDVLIGEARNGEVFFVRGVVGDWLEVLVGGKAGYLPRSAVRRAVAGAARGPGVPAQALAAEREKGRRYALLVGVREYDATQLKSLQFSEADIEGLAEILPGLGYKAEDVVVMTQGRAAKSFRHVPTADHIRRELSLLLSEAGPDDTLLVALAGHGVQFRGESDSYFCPADARLEDRATLLPLADVYKAMEGGKAGAKVMLVDACRNDPQSAVARSRAVVDLESVSRPQSQPTPGGVAAFFSCSTGQQAFEHPDLKHGVFFNYVIEGLKGAADLDSDEVVDLAELEQYAGKRVQNYVRTTLAQTQIPEHRGESRGGLSLGRAEGSPGLPLESALAYVTRGRKWSEEMAYGKAIRDFDAAIQLDPKFALAYFFRGDSRKATGDFDRAITDFDAAIQLAPNDISAYTGRAHARVAKGDLDGAISDYDSVIRIAPTFAEAYNARGIGRRNKGDLEGALADYNTAIQLDPKLADAYAGRGYTLRLRGNLDGAITDFDAAIQLNPKFAGAYNARGSARVEKGDFDAAMADFDAAIQLDPKLAGAYAGRGDVRRGKGDLDGAIADYDVVIQLDPKFAGGYAGRGSARMAKGDSDGAIRDCDAAIELDPKFVLAYIGRGTARGAKGDLDGAIADFDVVAQIAPQFAPAHVWRGRVRVTKGDLDGAIADFDGAIELDPKLADPYNALAWILATSDDARFRDGRRAVELATKACELTGWKEYSTLDTLAGALAEAGDFAAAVTRQQEAVALLGPKVDAKSAAGIRERLDLYRAGKPYREAPKP